MGIEQAVARADVLTNRLQAAYPDTNRNARFVLTPLGEGRGLRRASRPLLLLLTGVVALVLVVACVNIASLLLARAVSREPEVAIRLAMGASRARLVRQWLTESIVLGITGAIGALVVARVLTPLLHAFVIPEAVDLSLNGRVLAFTLVAGAGSGLVFGLAPVWRTLRPDLSAALRDRGTVSATPASVRMRNAFVVLQIAISLTLLVGAGLFLRTLANAYSVKLGYETTQTLVASLNLTPQGYFEGGARGAEAGSTAYEQILSRIEAIPGVAAASAARMTVLSGAARSTAVSLDGRPLETDGSNAIGVRANVVSRRYFETLQIPILRGRAFSESDRPTTPRVTIVTQSLADRLWPHDDPVGKSLRDEDQLLQVVGIVPDTVYTSTVERERPPTYYLPLTQNYESAVTLHVRAHDDPMSLVPRIRDAVRQVDRQIALEQPQRLGDVLDRTLGVQRMMATFVGLFGALALALAVLGLYGVMAHAASRRMPEIGVRLALGARPQAIAGLLIGDGLRLLGIGAALGLAAAFLVARSIESQLFGIAATDPLTFLIGCTVLAITSVMAATIPALRAMRIDPVTVLRQT
jgi:predicted permease